MSHRVFIAARSADKDSAVAICGLLEQAGIGCWIGERDLKEGDFQSQVAKAIKSSQLALLLLSESAGKSEFIKHEIAFVLDNSIPVLVVRVKFSALPDGLQLRLRFAGAKWVEAITRPLEQKFPSILNAVRHMLDGASIESGLLKDIEELERPDQLEPPAPYDGKENFVFVSYKREEMPRVAPFLHRMVEWGYNVWYDRGIPGGAEWDAMIEDRVTRCILLVTFISPKSVDSKWVRREIKFADSLNKPILAIRLETTELKEGLGLVLNQYQMIDATNADFSEELKRALEYVRLL